MSSARPELARPLSAPWLAGRHLARRATRLTVLLCTDLLLLGCYAFLVEAVHASPWSPPGFALALDELLTPGLGAGWGFPVAVVVALVFLGAYTAPGRRENLFRRVVAAVLIVVLPAWPALWAHRVPLVAEGTLLLASLLALCLVSAYRLSELSLRLVTPRRLRTATVLLVAAEGDLRRVQRDPALTDRGRFAIRGAVDPTALRGAGAFESLCQAIRRSGADTVVLCCGALGDRAFRVVLDAVNAMGCELASVARVRQRARGSAVVALASPAGRILQLMVKRVVDVVGAALALLLFAPVFAVLALAIKLDSRGPVLFGHRRVGAWGRPFGCLKFRTMRVDAERLLRSDPVMYAEYLRNNYKLPEGRDPRITRVGRLLRKTSLDELPQFWNVLSGDMSLIGPRPVVPDELSEYGGQRRMLLSVKPGITGAWAIHGRSSVAYPRRAAIEIGYVRRWRLGTDLAILWRTVPAVLTRRGAH